MSDLGADKFMEKMAKPGAEEEAFFARRRELGLGVEVDAEGKPARSKSLIFIDIEASSLSPEIWPIEVGTPNSKIGAWWSRANWSDHTKPGPSTIGRAKALLCTTFPSPNWRLRCLPRRSRNG